MQRLLIRARGVMRDSLNNGCILNNLLFNLVVLEAWPEKVVLSSIRRCSILLLNCQYILKKTMHMYAIYMTPMCCYESIHGLRMHVKDVS